MAYQTGDIILDSHYNTFATDVNNVWGTGTGDTGYGQSTTLSTVSDGTTITATQWSNLLNRISSSASHQGSSITAITNPSTSDPIEAFTALSGNISTIQANRTNAASWSGSSNSTGINNTDWTASLTITNTLTFAGGNEARWFFNAGGRIQIYSSHGGGNAKDNEWNDLCSKAGSYYINSTTGGKSGGSGSPSINLTSTGYYQLTNLSYTTMFRQYADTSPYTSNYITYNVQMNADDATDGLGNNGTIMTIQVILTDAAADQTFDKSVYTVQDNVTAQTTVTFNYDPPSTTYLSNTWGTPTWGTASVSAS